MKAAVASLHREFRLGSPLNPGLAEHENSEDENCYQRSEPVHLDLRPEPDRQTNGD
jgi:hypothetical protein